MMANQTLDQMDDAAKQAGEELAQQIERWSAKDLSQWWVRWYLKAGHKRLGRIVVDLNKNSRAR